MTSGIYLDIFMGRYYDEELPPRVRRGVKRLFGFDARTLSSAVIDDYIVNGVAGRRGENPGIYQSISRKYGRLLSKLPYDDGGGAAVTRGFRHRTTDLIKSFCFGIYRDGTLRRVYRFTGGKSDGWEPTEVQASFGMTSKDVRRLSAASVSHGWHPDPAERAQSFLSEYVPKGGSKGFSVVFAATMPYAVILENRGGGTIGGGKIRVMEGIKSSLIAMAAPLRSSGKAVQYGYIFGQ